MTDRTTGLTITDPEFWHQPLSARMAHFAELREQAPFTRFSFVDPLTNEDSHFYAVTRYAEVVEISRRPHDFCSGKGSTSIVDLPADAMEFFGSFIVMDDPRHARQRGIVARSFTPRQLQGVLDSVETICDQVIDEMCEKGEVDFVKAVSQPFPLLVICDMMGIPRSEFSTVLNATNVILGAGDPDFFAGKADPFTALLEAGMELTNLMNELAELRRANPADDLTSALVHNELGEDVLAPNEIAPFFILLA
ncbi:MAG TPA: cytochrome P450, partial [Acidimicrobiales bacterium]|nr:cytochrome P450 [Acidimicrobiales bacterium]